MKDEFDTEPLLVKATERYAYSWVDIRAMYGSGNMTVWQAMELAAKPTPLVEDTRDYLAAVTGEI